MKQIFTTLLVLATGITSTFAQTMLKVSLTDRRPITVSVDGRHFRKSGESVTVNDLPRGRHYVIVYVTETLSNGRTGEGVIWEGKVKTYQGQASLCLVDPHTRAASITEMDMYAFQQNQPADAQGYNNRNLNNYDTRSDNQGNTQNNNYQPDTYNNNSVPDENVAAPLPDGTPVASPVTIDEGEAAGKKSTKTTKKASTKTDKLKTKINVRTTDTEKFTAAKDVLKTETLTTVQVMSLMDCFSFESTKVEFAQWAYTKTSDKANFKQVKQKLTMKNYKEDMDKFLKNK